MSKDKIQELDNLLAGILREPPLISTNTEPPPPPLSDRPNNEEPSVHPPAVEASPNADHAAKQADQAKSLLAGLGRDTAIRLRWAMRDIRGKRLKMTPVSENDLAALMDLGFAELHEGTPRLTDLGALVLD